MSRYEKDGFDETAYGFALSRPPRPTGECHTSLKGCLCMSCVCEKRGSLYEWVDDEGELVREYFCDVCALTEEPQKTKVVL